MRGGVQRLVGAPGCALVALVAYVLTASPCGYWLDGGELMAAGLDLGISHPPGHPLSAIVSRALAYLPLGPLALRVAFASALGAAAGVAALCVAVRRTLELAGLTAPELARPIACAAALTVALCDAFWFQAVRPEVYGLQLALGLWTLERALALLQDGARASTLATAGLSVGLGLANHHLSTLLLLPTLAWPMWRVARAGRVRPLALAAAAVGVGLSSYVYLPLRAAADPLPNLGAPTDLARLWWVVSAQVYQRALTGFTPEPIAQRVIDVLLVLGDNLALLAVMTLGGAYIALRSARATAWVWLVALVVPAAVRAAAGFVRSNPDAAAYLVPSLAACAALAAWLHAAVVRGLAAPRPRLAAVLAWAALALAPWQLARSVARASLADFEVLDVFADPLRRELPPRAVVVAEVPDTAFALWGGMAEERTRPDVLVVPAALFGHPGMPESLARRAPELAPIFEAARGRDLSAADLLAMARVRPTLVEMDLRVPGELAPHLVPEGLYLRVRTAPVTRDAQRAGLDAQARAYDRLYARLAGAERETATRHRLLWRHFGDALYCMALGERGAALDALSRAQALAPTARPLAEMQRAAAAPGTGAIDVTPFVAGLSRLR